MGRPLAVGVLASGQGTTLEGLARAAEAEPDRFRVVVLITDRAGAPVIDRARSHGIPTEIVLVRGQPPDEWAPRVTEALARHGVELVVLAGFLPIFPPSWVERWQGRAVNTHPALLPRFGGRGMYGRRVHEAVIAAGERESGATVHLVTREVDQGPSIAQARLPVLPGDTPDTLRERLRPVEIGLLVATVRRFAAGELPLPYPGGDEPARADRAAEPSRER